MISFEQILDLIDQEIVYHKSIHTGKYLTFEAEENFIKGMVEIKEMVEQVRDKIRNTGGFSWEEYRRKTNG